MYSVHLNRWAILRVSLALAVGMVVALTAWAQSPGRHQGTIASVSDSLLVLEVEGVEFPFRWDNETTVTLNGDVVELTDLQPGDSASVNFRRAEDGVMLATFVEATRA